MHLSSGIHPGELVEVLSLAQISSTLDSKGTLRGLAFAPEMHKFCGRKLRVLRRLNNIMIEGVGMRRMENAVILDGAVCDGEYHMGCAMMCHLVWKTQWLKRVRSPLGTDRKTTRSMTASPDLSMFLGNNCSPCQATSLQKASFPPSRSMIRQYLWSLEPGALTPVEIIRDSLKELRTRCLRSLQHENGTKVTGENTRTPTASLVLQPGELVEVKSVEEIKRTLDKKGRNRGLLFNPEMLQYCGKRFKVLKRVNIVTNEATREVRQVENTVILEGAVCDGKAHGRCQRRCPCLWREIWLRRA